MENLIAFIGFGEAAFHIAKGLKIEGLSNIVAYDANQNDDKKGIIIKKRADEIDIILKESVIEACSNAKFIFSLTSAKVCYELASTIIPNLVSGQIYVDMNSASPQVKSDIGKIKHAEGVQICDAAIMGKVPGNGHKVPMILSGDGASAFCIKLIRYGMNMTDLNAPLGGASAIKMFRSVVMKGLPQLMIESMMAAEKYGVLDTLLESLNDSLKGSSIEQLAEQFIARTIVHAERRSSEMEDVILTLESLNIDASMSKSTKEKLEKIAKLHLIDKIGAAPSIDYKEAIQLLISNTETISHSY